MSNPNQDDDDDLYIALNTNNQTPSLIDLDKFVTSTSDYGFLIDGGHYYVQVVDNANPDHIIEEIEITPESYGDYLDSTANIVQAVGVYQQGLMY